MGLIPQTLSRSVERYGLGYIRPRHEEIARRLVCGQNQSDIARHMGINIGRLSIIVNSPLFKVVLARLSKLRDDSATDIQEEIKALAPIALEQVASTIMTSTSEKLRLSASQDLLDRAGLAKKGNVGVQINIGAGHPVDLEKYKGDAVTVEVKAEPSSDNGGNGANGESAVQSVNTSEEDTAEDMKLLEDIIGLEESEEDNK